MTADGMVTRIPATLATRRGAAYIAEQAADRTVVLTNHGRPTAVVMSPAEHDEHLRILRDAADRMISQMADLVASRSAFHTEDEARERLRAHR